jgi:hypothetical protein
MPLHVHDDDARIDPEAADDRAEPIALAAKSIFLNQEVVIEVLSLFLIRSGYSAFARRLCQVRTFALNVTIAASELASKGGTYVAAWFINHSPLAEQDLPITG